MFFRSKIACKKMLKQMSDLTSLPISKYRKQYKSKHHLYNAVYRAYISLSYEGRAVIGNVIGFCPHCLAHKKPKNYRTIAHNMRFYSAGEALDKFADYINEMYSFMNSELENNKDKAVKK